MRIGLITDTHIPEVASELPSQVDDAFRDVALILHAGDIFDISVLDHLERIAPVLAVLGDDDHRSLAEDKRIARYQQLELEGYYVWLMHEGPWFYRLEEPRADHVPHVIVHGHSHDARIHTEKDGIMTICSGSPTFLNYKRGPGSVAILELGPGGPEANIIGL
jgi:putative phosphoesterase